MKIKLTNLFFLIFLAMKCFAQEKSTTIFGKIYNSQKTISDAHIINLNSKLGTVSNDYGEFKLQVALNDTLLVSSIQYKRKRIVITKRILESKRIAILLIPLVHILDEVFLHNLSGNLALDLNGTPKDTIPKHNFIYKLSDLNKILPPDQNGLKKVPNARALTDPTFNEGISASATIPDYFMIAKRKLKQTLNKKKQFPIKIRKELGLDFFTKILKIPEEKIDHFLAYCEYRNIIDKYYNNKLLEIIKILREESKNYYEIKD